MTSSIVDEAGMCQSLDPKNNSCIDHDELINRNMIIYIQSRTSIPPVLSLESTRLEMIIRVLLQLTPASWRIKFETLIGLCPDPRSKQFSANLQDTLNPPQTWTSSIKPNFVICISDRTSNQALERFLAWDTPGSPERKLRVAAAWKWKFSVRPTGVLKSGQVQGRRVGGSGG